jgi:hypothetical protein
MRKRANIVCVLRKPRKKIRDAAPNAAVYRNSLDDRITVCWYQNKDGMAEYLTGLRSIDARLLARRLKQFLDADG